MTLRTRHYPIAVPTGVHPAVARLYEEMNAQRCTHIDLSERSGVAAKTLKDWRRHGSPTITNLEACLNVLGLELCVRARRE